MKIPTDMTGWEQLPEGTWRRRLKNGKVKLYYLKPKCETCGDPFFAEKFMVDRYPSMKGKFCSRNCGVKAIMHPKGKHHPNWKGGKRICDGYVLIWNPAHPDATKDGYVPEHRLLIERHIGRKLNKDELVHHINGNRRDNRVENLQLVTRSEHHKLHYDEKTGIGTVTTGRFKEGYDPRRNHAGINQYTKHRR